MNSRLLVALYAALPMTVMTVGAPYAVAEEVTKSAPADARGEVEIVNVAGAVEVNGWIGPKCRSTPISAAAWNGWNSGATVSAPTSK